MVGSHSVEVVFVVMLVEGRSKRNAVHCGCGFDLAIGEKYRRIFRLGSIGSIRKGRIGDDGVIAVDNIGPAYGS